jgi:DNA-nicking Smr family endonuclease
MTGKKPSYGSSHLVPDAELWEQVRRAVRPLHVKHSFQAERHPGKHAPPAQAHIARPASARVSPGKSSEPPQLTGLDRRTAQKLTRGKLRYEAKLDLHGLRVTEARVQLASFLRKSRSREHALVLVVTGKGSSPYARHTLHGDSHYHVPERQGLLRQLITSWLHEPEFREHIAGFQPAHPKHGGGGAFYVRLRRPGAPGR